MEYGLPQTDDMKSPSMEEDFHWNELHKKESLLIDELKHTFNLVKTLFT